jgi:hypothetical protein
MNFIEGQTLQKLVDRQGRLPYETAVNYIAQIAEAVDYIHNLNILHRDIKPDNIIITPDNRAILLDFGSAREFIHDKTQMHTSILTPGYAPPEQYSSTSRKGAYSDIYSLGAPFYFALTATMPTDAAARSFEVLPEPNTLVSNIPDEANHTIMKAMQLKPEDRYQHVNEFMGDLLNNEAFGGIGNQLPPDTPSGTNKEDNIGLWISIIATFAVVVIIMFALFSYIQEKNRAELYAYNTADTIEECDEYLANYPNGKYRGEVQNIKRDIQEKEAARQAEQRRLEQERKAYEEEQKRIAMEGKSTTEQKIEQEFGLKIKFSYEEESFNNWGAWSATEITNIYNNDRFEKICGRLEEWESFKMISNNTFYFEIQQIRVAKIFPSEQDGCNNVLKVGDLIYLLHYQGDEGIYSAYHNEKVIHVCLDNYDSEAKKIRKTAWEDCYPFEGTMIQDIEKSVFIAKIRSLKDNKEGWIKFVEDQEKQINTWTITMH